MQQKIVSVLNLGRIGYQAALEIQNYYAKKHLDHLAGKKAEPAKNMLLLLEHNPVYTTGLRTRDYSEEEEFRLCSLGAEFYRTDRGGLITFHGPGQLVAYPIMNLKQFSLGMRHYVCRLQKSVIGTCGHFGVTTTTTDDPGVWIENRKICALGVHGRRFVTTHGIALNCDIDMTWYNHITPCGLEGKGVTSLTLETKSQISIQDTIPVFLEHFAKAFDCDIETL